MPYTQRIIFQISNVKSDIRKYLWIWHVYSMYSTNLLVVVYVCHVCHLSIFVKQTFNCLFLVKNEMSKNLNIIDIDRHIAFYHFHYSTNFNQYPYLDYFKTSLKLSWKMGAWPQWYCISNIFYQGSIIEFSIQCNFLTTVPSKSIFNIILSFFWSGWYHIYI